MPSGLPYLCALVLAAAFAVAALTKLADPAATARTFAALGVPRPWPMARAVPLVEALLAVGLVVAPGWAAVAGLVVLAGFTVFLAGRLRAGVRTPCGCFGSGKDPLSWVDLARNGGLLLLAAVAVGADAPSVPSRSAVALGAATLVVAVAALRAARTTARHTAGDRAGGTGGRSPTVGP